jgi:hypothetical protein
MIGKRTTPLLGLHMLLIASPASGQTPPPASSQPPAPGSRKRTGDDEKRAEQPDEQIDKAVKADRLSADS